MCGIYNYGLKPRVNKGEILKSPGLYLWLGEISKNMEFFHHQQN